MSALNEQVTHGMTYQAPWAHAILFAGKRLENRGKGVATSVTRAMRAGILGRVALTQSARHRLPDGSSVSWGSLGKGLARALDDVRETMIWMPAPFSVTARHLVQAAGKVVATARITRVRGPDEKISAWHEDGQYGLVLDDVRPVIKVPIRGGLGLWKLEACACGRLVAHGARCCGRSRESACAATGKLGRHVWYSDCCGACGEFKGAK